MYGFEIRQPPQFHEMSTALRHIIFIAQVIGPERGNKTPEHNKNK